MTPTFPLTQATIPAPMQDNINPMQTVALGICMVDLVILFSRISDQFNGLYHLPGFGVALLIFAALASGKLFRGLSNRTLVYTTAFLGWTAIACVFSIWRSYSLPSFNALLLAFLYAAVISGLVTTFNQIRKIILAIALSYLIASLLSFVFSHGETSQRLELAYGTYHDPNQYAMSLLIGIPLWWYLAASAKSNFGKVLCWLCTLPLFVVFFMTGSRGGLVGLLSILFMNLLFSSLSKRLFLIVVLVIGAVAAIAFMPDYIKLRYKTFLDSSDLELNKQSGDTAHLLEGDKDSAEGRRALVFRSVQLTLQHPLLGVGPGNFPTAVFTQAEQNHEQYRWVVSHNAYTQISSETGIPGLIFFVAALAYAFKNLRQVARITKPQGVRPWPEMFALMKYIRLALVGTAVSIFFLSAGYQPEIYVFMALTVAAARIVQIEMAKAVPAPNPERLAPAAFVARPTSAAVRYPQQPRRFEPRIANGKGRP